jgi:dienelactone hydrolase
VIPGARRIGLSVTSRTGLLSLGALALAVLAAACAPRAAPLVARPSVSTSASQPASVSAGPVRPAVGATGSASARPVPVAVGTAGAFGVGQRELVLTEPAHTGVAGERLRSRILITQLWYPVAVRATGSPPARGPFPLLLFAPGFMQCADPYADLLTAWASAGYVVAAVDFPSSDCRVGAAATESDLVNQPEDLSYALSRLLRLSSEPGNRLSGLLNPHEIAATGQSDGGDTVAALGANTCCADHRLAAVAVLSGAEWPLMPGRYFAAGAPPMLFVQGSADTINPPVTSAQLYGADAEHARYYLDLFGADHTVPYWGTNKVERLVVRVTLAFFDRYVLDQASAATAMTRDGNVNGVAALVANGRPVP